jgi:hypothetical protein
MLILDQKQNFTSSQGLTIGVNLIANYVQLSQHRTIRNSVLAFDWLIICLVDKVSSEKCGRLIAKVRDVKEKGEKYSVPSTQRSRSEKHYLYLLTMEGGALEFCVCRFLVHISFQKF